MLQRERRLTTHRSVSLTPYRTLILCLIGLTTGVLLVNIIQIIIGSKTITCGFQGHGHYTSRANTSHGRQSDSHEKFLFVGIMTARKYLTTRAMASSRTWAARVPGKVVYFLEKGEAYQGDLNVVQLEGIKENDYPPQKKSFAMLQFINEHYAQDYEWIVRADDDLYIKVEELVKFLKSLDHRRLLYIGQPGYGGRRERGKLGLAGAYCMGGPGVVLSNTSVRALSPHLADCLNSTVTQHEDTELGRCINTHLKLVCSSSLDMSTMFYQNYARSWDKVDAMNAGLGVREENALTLHPFKESSYVFKAANFFTYRTVQKLQVKEARLTAETAITQRVLVNKTGNILPDKRRIFRLIQWAPTTQLMSTVNKPDTKNSSFFQKERNIYDLYNIWDMLKYKSLYSVFLESRRLTVPSTSKGRWNLNSNTLKTLKAARWYPVAKDNKRQLGVLGVSYQHLSTGQGIKEVLFIRNVSKEKPTILPVFVRRSFLQHVVEFRESPEDYIGDTGNKEIHILMTVFMKSECYRHYLQMHKKAVDGYPGKVVLRVVLFADKVEEHRNISAATATMLKDNPDLQIHIIHVNETFGRARGLVLAMENLDNSSLLLLMDVDMDYTSDFLHRVSRNSALGRSAYFPVVFSQFSPEVVCYKRDNCEQFMRSLHDDVGIWRSFGYGVVSVIKEDLLRAGGFKTDIKGWGMEDVDLYEKLITTVGSVIRAPDNGIIHRYHERECSRSLPHAQMTSCRNSRLETYGSFKQLYKIYEDMTDTNRTAQSRTR